MLGAMIAPIVPDSNWQAATSCLRKWHSNKLDFAPNRPTGQVVYKVHILLVKPPKLHAPSGLTAQVLAVRLQTATTWSNGTASYIAPTYFGRNASSTRIAEPHIWQYTVIVLQAELCQLPACKCYHLPVPNRRALMIYPSHYTLVVVCANATTRPLVRPIHLIVP
jgi:hypothetical protein